MAASDLFFGFGRTALSPADKVSAGLPSLVRMEDAFSDASGPLTPIHSGHWFYASRPPLRIKAATLGAGETTGRRQSTARSPEQPPGGPCQPRTADASGPRRSAP